MPGYILCPKCYKSIREGIPFCPHCGEKQVDKRAKDEFGKDPYYVLQVSHHAEPEVIEAAYKRLAKKYHPDYNKSPEAQERIKELNWAYGILGNTERREEYDKAKRKKTQQQSGEFKPRQEEKREEKQRPSPSPKKSTPSPSTSYNKKDKSTNRLGWIFVTVLIIMIGLCFFVTFLSSTNNSTGSTANSENMVISDNNKSPTRKTTRIPTNTPPVKLDYFNLEITRVDSSVMPQSPLEKYLQAMGYQQGDGQPPAPAPKDEIVETYKAIEYQNVSRHIGERLAVCGTVTSVYQAGLLGVTYIEFGSKFAAIISQSNRSDFEDILEYLKVEDICVYGSIYKENNNIYLELTDILHIFGDFWEKVELSTKWDYPPDYYYPPDNDNRLDDMDFWPQNEGLPPNSP